MTRPFILTTVSPWPSVRKWLLILALNLPACQCVEGEQSRYGMRGVRSAPCPRTSPRSAHQRPLPHPPHHLFSPGGACSPQSADKSRRWCLMGENKRRFYANPCVASPICRYGGTRRRRRRMFEWQPDGSHNKTVIERYVIVTISSRGKSVSKRHSRGRKKKRRKGTSFN